MFAGLGIGMHSLELLIPNIPDALGQIEHLTHFMQNLPVVGHAHHHAIDVPVDAKDIHAAIKVNPHALWVAAASILAKEWLFRASKSLHWGI